MRQQVQYRDSVKSFTKHFFLATLKNKILSSEIEQYVQNAPCSSCSMYLSKWKRLRKDLREW